MTTRRPPGPSWDVEVNVEFGSPTYGNLAAELYGWDTRGWWETLGDLLGGRPGWHCDFTSGGILWSFGVMGASLFNITAPESGEEVELLGDPVGPTAYQSGVYTLFDYEADVTHTFHGTAQLLAWLELNEGRHADHARRLKGIASSNDWAVLKAMGIEVRVTHDESAFIATFPAIPFETAMSPDLLTLLVRAKEAIALAHDAPLGVAPEISVVARLDVAATRALTG